MEIFKIIKYYCRKRIVWFFLLLISLVLIFVTWYLQYSLNLIPCNLCTYQRYIIYLITILSIIMLINPKNNVIYLLTFTLILISTFYGLYLSIKQKDNKIDHILYGKCDLPNFSLSWLLPDEKLSSMSIFDTCYYNEKLRFFLEIPNFMILIFSAYLLFSVLGLLSYIIYKINI